MTDELERLLGLPLDEFTAARTEAAKRLRKEGRADEAAELQAVRKPTAAVWGLNQAARREPGDVRALVRAAERVREDPAGADADFRSHLGDVVREAERALREAGTTVSEATSRRIGTTARAAAASLPDELVRGILREELEPAGFEAMAGMTPPPTRARGTPRKAAPRVDAAAKRREQRARVEAARRELAEARDEARRLGREADAAERAAAKAKDAAAEAEEAVRRAEERLDAARRG